MRLTDGVFQLFTSVGAEWVLWLLAGLSVASVMLIIERLLFFSRNRLPDAGDLLPLLAAGKFDEVRAAVAGRTGLEAEVLAAALAEAVNGPDSVEEVIAGAIMRHRQPYERYLSFLGTLGNNAPFIGLFGTVIGIIDAFAKLAVGTAAAKGAGASAVMSGISEALVATAVGIFVAIPAVVAFNAYNRWLKTITARTNALGHAVVAYLKREER
ncbi:MotA/TolQ/ExbB proton channel family protein [Vulgatibacter incomptus]|uniref:MotA/TolQ/ExbB proton channel family protein n=1 Tax=Vulgatibacter incomptus TaxID=1391653 RepID=A0A0K1PFN3_9BACT|nr:MotA/TolQ/ExbB proton channel family protein [Vulgatibacter incomptus]AKU92330.1 MotA/TolQ/ExbB proton channel family protein [Vulgatibacter incomptus]